MMIRYLLLLLLALTAVACSSGPVENPDPPVVALTISPAAITLHPDQSQQFIVTDSNAPAAISWSVLEGPGSISMTGMYTVPPGAVADTLRFWIEATSGTRSGRARVTIVPGHQLAACFERDVQPIIRSSCALAGCHDPGGQEGGYDFTTYLGVRQAVVPGRPDQSIMVRMITHEDEYERMPPEPRSPLSESQIATIIHWIADGALGAPCPGDAPCNTTDITYSGTIRQILDAKCVSCHTDGHPDSGGIDLTAYSGVRSVALTGQLYGSVSHAPGYAPMPSPADTLDVCQILQIVSWIEKGAPQN